MLLYLSNLRELLFRVGGVSSNPSKLRKSFSWVPATALLAGTLAAGHAFGGIEGQLTFSVDGGKTYSEKPPVVAEPQEIYVKADWVIEGEDRSIKDNVVVTNLHSEEGDFASANLGKQNWSQPAAWYQRIEKSWFNAKSDHTAVYRLDLRARPEGVMGKNNVWNKETSKNADGPLPATEALAPGVHNFIFEATYRVEGESTPQSAKMPFQVTIGPAK